MTLVGADPDAPAVGVEPLPGRSNYLTGRDPSKWHTNIPTYAKVRYERLYPGVDLVYHGAQGSLEYDFILRPGADPDVIRIDFSGVNGLRLDSNGELAMGVGITEVRQRRPIAYQELADGRHEVPVGFVARADGKIGFAVGDYDRRSPLVIDPVLAYSTYLGGTGSGSFEYDRATDIAVDALGNSYVTGLTGATDFPTVNPLFPGGGQFVAKFDPDGALIYSTYLPATIWPGFAFPPRASIAADSSGNAYVTGTSFSLDFPTTPGAYRETGSGFFLMKLAPNGDALIYSTFVPTGPDLAVDLAGNAYLAGNGLPTAEFPAINPLPADRGPSDAWVAKVNASGSALVYGVSLGGSGGDQALGIAVDAAGYAYVTGSTNSSDFPTMNAAQPVLGGPLNVSLGDCFVTKLTPEGNAIVYSTYLGGARDEGTCSIGADDEGNAYVGVTTASLDYPTWNALQPNKSGGGEWDGAVTKFNPDGALVFSTFLGGSSYDYVTGVAADREGNVYVTGETQSPDFPVVNPVQADLAGFADAFVTKIDPLGSALIYSTFLGGSASDGAAAIAVDIDGAAYVAGDTSSDDFPVANAVQPSHATLTDGFVTKLAEPGCPDDVTSDLDIVALAIQRIPLTPYYYQWVFLRNRTAVPIEGPLGYVLNDLQNATFLNSAATTTCVSPSGDPFTLIGVGDGVLSPREWTVGLLFFRRTQPGMISYAPRVLAGAPPAGT